MLYILRLMTVFQVILDEFNRRHLLIDFAKANETSQEIFH